MTVLALLAAMAVGAPAAPADTILMLGSRSIDLTGDGRPEQLQLVAAGPSPDELTVTLTILDGFELLYATELPVPSTSTALRELGEAFFADERFTGLDWFGRTYGRSTAVTAIARDRGQPADTAAAAAIWDDLQERRPPVFLIATGRNDRTAIAWSEAERGFVTIYRSYTP